MDRPKIRALASSGLLAITGEPGGKPTILGGHVAQSAVGIYVALAAAAALFGKEATGSGQIVDISAPQCLATLAEQVWVEYSVSGEVLERMGSRGGMTALAGALPCADGHWMVSVTPDPRGWGELRPARARSSLQGRRIAGGRGAAPRAQARDSGSYRAVVQAAQENGNRRGGAASPYTRGTGVDPPLELIDDAQLLARGFLKPVDHPNFGRMNFPVGALASIWGRDLTFAPRLGQNTAEILNELGYSAVEIGRLKDKGVVRT